MSSVPPLLTPTPPPAASAAPVAAEVVVVQAPPQAAAQLAALKLLEALVLSQKEALAQLKTQLGTMQVKLPFPVPEGARLTFQVGAAQIDGFPALKLATVDGKPPTPAMMAGRLAMTPPMTMAMNRPAVEMATTSGGAAPLLATVLKPAAQAPGAPVLLAGTVFPVRLQSVSSGPLTSSSQAPVLPQTATLPGAPPQAAGPLPGMPPSGSPPQPTNTAMPGAMAPAPTPSAAPSLPGAAPTAFTPPTASTAQAAPAPTPAPAAQPLPAAPPQAATAAPTPQAAAPAPVLPGELSGTVAPNTHAGQPLVQTDLGLVSLQGSPPLPPGAKVTLSVTGPATAPAAAAATATAGPWSGLSQAIGVLAQSDPAAAARLTASLPQLGPRLAEGMVAFVATAQNNALRPVLGERSAQALERIGRGEVAKRLLDDLHGAEPQARRDAGGEWRMMTMPLLNGGTVEPVRLFLRRPDPDGEDAGGGAGGDKGQRFLVDVTLSALGRLQIDGLMKRSAKRLNVLVRTAQPLPAEMRQDISRLFADGCAAAGVSGEAGFQVTQRFVDPAAGAAAPVAGVVA